MSFKALVLGGGGVKGEFEIGVLEYLADQGCEFDFFSGVSVGALNSSLLAQHTSLSDGVHELKRLWDRIEENSDIYETPFGGKVTGALLSLFTEAAIARDAIFKSKPLQRLISNHIDWKRIKDSGKGWAVGVTSLTDGNYYLLTNLEKLLEKSQETTAGRLHLSLDRGTIGSIPDRVEEFVLASASMPLLFPPVEIYGHSFVDGGLRDITPLSSAFEAARLQGDEKCSILAVSTSPRLLPYRGDSALDSGLEIIGRTLDILCHEILENDLKDAEETNQLRGPRLIKADVVSLRPDFDVGLGNLDFKARSKRASLREQGLEVARKEMKDKVTLFT